METRHRPEPRRGDSALSPRRGWDDGFWPDNYPMLAEHVIAEGDEQFADLWKDFLLEHKRVLGRHLTDPPPWRPRAQTQPASNP